jgi:hypothetical protein
MFACDLRGRGYVAASWGFERFASVTSTLEMIERRGRCESGDALSRLLLHCIDGKNMWGEKCVMRGK